MGFEDTTYAGPHTILAINIALTPDATMTRQAQAANTQVLKLYPQGFALKRRMNPTSLCFSGMSGPTA
ncbi:MAG: hypothetical protein PHY16_20060 [Methylobacter sp.]|nr:hypothetical protein [Methylobacter sp.]